ncbi:MAG TPA: Lrp/AsnC ligand binding domain-containing protein [Methanotrichaceae archaeon]|nr:Lrp/AsnC ligand binding domain-containing protein [Methanotrichaceae archaeon]
MVLALTMIKVQPGYEKSVYRDLQRRRGVRDVYRLFGEFNFFLIMQAERRSMLNSLLNEIKEDGKVIKTGPVLLTVDGDMSEMAYAEAEAAFG